MPANDPPTENRPTENRPPENDPTASRPFLDELHAALTAPQQRPQDRVSDEGAYPPAQRRLRSLLEEVRSARPQAQLEAGSAAAVRDALQRLAGIAMAYDADGIERRAADTYAAPAALRADLDLFLALTAAPDPARRLLTMQTYVRRAPVPETPERVDLGELAIDRRLVLQRLAMNVALTAPHQIDELSANFDIFRQRYERAYREHRRRFHADVRALRRTLDSHRAHLDALALLNAIGELGAAAGSALRQEWDALRLSLTSCDVNDADLTTALQHDPVCPACDLTLGDGAPAADVDRWVDECRAAIRTKQRHLAGAMVARAIAETHRPTFDRFLRAVQASDIAPLVEVMDDGVAQLIRQLLARDA